jgi:deaminated glutathione amidase
VPPVNVIDGPLTTLLRDERTIDYAAVRNRWAIDHVTTLAVDPGGAAEKAVLSEKQKTEVRGPGVTGDHGQVAVLKVATCQFPVSADIGANLRYVKRQMATASRRGARVAHFPEGSLSGYAGTDFESFADFDWGRLHDATAEVATRARQLRLWVVLGSAHRLSGSHKPHNSLYVISDSGQIVERYDKRFCSGDPGERSGDLAHYSPGSHFSVWSIDGIRCGALICYDYRYPELYREYKKRGIQLVFHSFHTANASPRRIAMIGAAIGAGLEKLNPAATHTYPGITMPAAMTTAAACNHVWISCSNSSAPQSCWPAFFVRADGITTGRLRRNVPGVLISTVDTGEELYDSTAAWREQAMAGVLHSGTLVSDPRSDDRTRV